MDCDQSVPTNSICYIWRVISFCFTYLLTYLLTYVASVERRYGPHDDDDDNVSKCWVWGTSREVPRRMKRLAGSNESWGARSSAVLVAESTLGYSRYCGSFESVLTHTSWESMLLVYFSCHHQWAQDFTCIFLGRYLTIWRAGVSAGYTLPSRSNLHF